MYLDDLLIAASRMHAASSPSFDQEIYVAGGLAVPPDEVVPVEAPAFCPKLRERFHFSGFEADEMIESVQRKITHTLGSRIRFLAVRNNILWSTQGDFGNPEL
jgi:hypothetical protein